MLTKFTATCLKMNLRIWCVPNKNAHGEWRREMYFLGCYFCACPIQSLSYEYMYVRTHENSHMDKCELQGI